MPLTITVNYKRERGHKVRQFDRTSGATPELTDSDVRKAPYKIKDRQLGCA